MFSFLKKTFNILRVGFVSRIYMNAIGCMFLGLSIGSPSTGLRFIFVVAGALVIAETWFQFGFRRATVINALKK
jgi:hypothetical protein